MESSTPTPEQVPTEGQEATPSPDKAASPESINAETPAESTESATDTAEAKEDGESPTTEGDAPATSSDNVAEDPNQAEGKHDEEAEIQEIHQEEHEEVHEEEVHEEVHEEEVHEEEVHEEEVHEEEIQEEIHEEIVEEVVDEEGITPEESEIPGQNPKPEPEPTTASRSFAPDDYDTDIEDEQSDTSPIPPGEMPGAAPTTDDHQIQRGPPPPENGPSRKWLMDRIDGTSKYGDGKRPWGRCCWVPPVVGWCPGLLEENAFCRMCGGMGACGSEKSRNLSMHIGFLANLCACMLFAYSCFAISQDYHLLSTASFGSLTMTEKDNKFDDEITLDIGLRAVALNNPVTNIEEVVVQFDQFCDARTEGLQRYMDNLDCRECSLISTNLVISSILAVVSFLPTLFTDVNRMFSGYDVNCQKTFGVVFSFLTIGLGLNIIICFQLMCADKFYQGTIYLDDEGWRVKEGNPNIEYTVDYEYKWGSGMIVLVIGMALKFIEVVAHCCVPTPTVTRVTKEQQIYEVYDEEAVEC